jgi:pimeloyl-ACP methyl ester carboxylesterase
MCSSAGSAGDIGIPGILGRSREEPVAALTDRADRQISQRWTIGEAMTKYVELPNLTVKTETGASYSYRDTGGSGVPLVLLQHFRGNLDNWDPVLVDELASHWRVVAFDNLGVGGSDGTPASSVAGMAAGALAFLEALDLREVNLLGFSIGSFVAQEIALTRPSAVTKVVLASSAPKGAPGMHGWAPDVIGAVGAPEPGAEGYLSVFFTDSPASRNSGREVLARIYSRTEDRDEPTSWECRVAQYDAVCEWGTPNRGLLERLEAISMPVFVANGDRDPMILPRYSYVLAGLLPDAKLKIYPDSAHGFLFQHHEQFVADLADFLGSP